MTFWNDLLKNAERCGEPIEAVVIGDFGWDGFGEDDKALPPDTKGHILTPEGAAAALSYDYSSGYGAPECHAVYAWTASRVFYVSQYDGSTEICSIPRNPTAEMPEMPGG